ncbi:MAG TPA: magnesium/cobalt transporter CorA [Vicinamibacterales bacterium]|nr:magnesium/cobalt transporter CorA [Vicinamibacterales bacterium]
MRRNGALHRAERVEPEWLDPSSGTTVWVDMAAPAGDELQLLAEVFHLHPLSVEDARSSLQFPKAEPYQGYLYVVLHGIDVRKGSHAFATRDVDFFLGHNWLVTVHDGESTSIAHLRELCDRHDRLLAEGPVGLLHRIVDSMVDSYRPAMEALEHRIDHLEEEAVAGQRELARRMLKLRHELAEMRRVLMPQRDVLGRLGRREFSAISDEMAYRFRDVYDHVVRLADEAILFQDRVTGILEVNLASISNRLNQVMKVLTVMSTIFLPLTVLSGMWGMNVTLPRFPGGEPAQFWWVTGIMVAVAAAMLAVFRRNRWM